MGLALWDPRRQMDPARSDGEASEPQIRALLNLWCGEINGSAKVQAWEDGTTILQCLSGNLYGPQLLLTNLSSRFPRRNNLSAHPHLLSKILIFGVTRLLQVLIFGTMSTALQSVAIYARPSQDALHGRGIQAESAFLRPVMPVAYTLPAISAATCLAVCHSGKEWN